MRELTSKLRNILIAPSSESFDVRTKFWFFFTMALITTYSLMALKKGFANDYIVEDDQREFLGLCYRFVDGELFPNDLITNYYATITPIGYKAFFWLIAKIGINPLFVFKILIFFIPIIGSIYFFFISLEIIPVPIVGFMATVMLNQNIWMNGLMSSTPRGFVYVLFPAFIYYFLRKNIIGYLTVIILAGLLYPSILLIMMGIAATGFINWHNGKLTISTEKQDIIFYGLGIAFSFLAILPFALSSSEFGPAVTLAQAKLMPEFGQEGRVPFFSDNPIEFYLFGWQSGIFAYGPFKPPRLIWAFLTVPFLLQFSSTFPLAKKVKPSVMILLKILVVSLGLFIVANILLLKLYLPNRFTMYTLRMLIALSAAIALTIIIDALLHWTISGIASLWKSVVTMSVVIFVGSSLILLPVYINIKGFDFPLIGYVQPKENELYSFLSQQPKNTLTASLTNEVDNLPTFAKRPILTGFEYAVPFYLGFYREIKQRTIDLIHAQYSVNLADVKQFIKKYSVDYFLLTHKSFEPNYVKRNVWFKQWQDLANEVLNDLNQGKIPALSKVQDKCTAIKTKRSMILVKAECIMKITE